MWNLERWYCWNYFQGSNGDTEQTYGHGGGAEEGEGGMYGERSMEVYMTVRKIDSQWEFAVWLRELKPGLCSHLEGWDGEGGSEGGGICLPMADSCWFVAETNTIL